MLKLTGGQSVFMHTAPSAGDGLVLQLLFLIQSVAFC